MNVMTKVIRSEDEVVWLMSKITENDAVQMNIGLQMIIFGPNIATNTLLTRNPINKGR